MSENKENFVHSTENNEILDSAKESETSNYTNGEIELDPYLDIGQEDELSEQKPVVNQPIEPIPPQMPIIENNKYTPISAKETGKGVKIFAILIVIMVVISACVTGGFFLGRANMNTDLDVTLASRPTDKKAKSYKEIFEEVNPSVVGISIYNDKGVSAIASGVIYSKDGYIITNDHVYSKIESPKFKVYTYDGRSYDGEFIAGDTRSDIAVIKVKGNNDFKPATFGNSNEIIVGEDVAAIGRTNGATSPSTISGGIISIPAVRVSTTSTYTSKLIQTDSAINPGSSGGALCNVYGQVIGITSAKLVGDYEGVGYAIPTTTVKKNVEALIKYKSVKGRAKLGISYYFIDELTAEINNIPCGLQIGEISKESDLYGKSVLVDDIITHINGEKIINQDMVLDVIDQAFAGDKISLTVYSVKTGKSFAVTARLLEDGGQSSYIAKKDDTSSGTYNSSQFDFPNGE